MNNNAAIRERMNTYRGILLALVWIGAGIGIIAGFIIAGNRYTTGIGIGVAIGSVVAGIIAHFLVNVFLAIPFILLNNGDMLAALAGGERKDVHTPELTNNSDHLEKHDSMDTSDPVEKSVPKFTNTYLVLVNTWLKDSLSPVAKMVVELQSGEKVELLSLQDREDLGGKWARVETKSKVEGWVLLSALRKAD